MQASNLRKAFLVSALTSILGACGGGGGSDSPPPAPAPAPQEETDTTPAELTVDTDLGIREDIVLTFNEAMNPDSLELEGLLWDLADSGTWNSANTELRLKPIEGSWESGIQKLAGSVEDAAGNSTAIDVDFEIRLVFENFQKAIAVIGQPDFQSFQENQSIAVTENTLSGPLGLVTFYQDRMWIADYGNNRILGYERVPEANNASATWVIGQPDFSSSLSGIGPSELYRPQGVEVYDDRLYLLDDNSRILIFDDVPLTPPAEASHIIGQPDLYSFDDTCSASGLDGATGMYIVNGKLIVADQDNNRVLIWDNVPKDVNGDPADLVLGQESLEHCVSNDDDQDGIPDEGPSSRTLSRPSSVWSDGERLAVLDWSNRRVLIWETFPKKDFQAADVVLTQEIGNGGDFGGAIWSNGVQLFVADTANSRVLIWNRFPISNLQKPDVVLGQSNFVNNVRNDDNQDGIDDRIASNRTLNRPNGGGVRRDKIVVLDMYNSRALVFRSR